MRALLWQETLTLAREEEIYALKAKALADAFPPGRILYLQRAAVKEIIHKSTAINIRQGNKMSQIE